MGCINKAENCKNHFKIVRQIIFFLKNDVATDVAQCESNSIKRYASAFSNIYRFIERYYSSLNLRLITNIGLHNIYAISRIGIMMFVRQIRLELLCLHSK